MGGGVKAWPSVGCGREAAVSDAKSWASIAGWFIALQLVPRFRVSFKDGPSFLPAIPADILIAADVVWSERQSLEVL